NKNFKGFAAFHKFLEAQISGWEKIENLPQELLESKRFFTRAQKYIEDFYTSYKDIPESANLDSYWRSQVIKQITAININIFTFDSSEVDFLLNIRNSLPKSFTSAFSYLCGDLPHNMNAKDNFNGYLMAYEFRTKDSKITE